MIDTPDFIKMNRSLSKRIGRRDEAAKPIDEKNEKEEESSLPPVMISNEKINSLRKKLRKLLKRRDELNEAWRLAVEEGDDRETDALTVSLKLLEENHIEINKTQDLLDRAIPHNNRSSNTVEIGSRVQLSFSGSTNEIEIILVDPVEADPRKNKFSFESPLGKAVIGRSIGDETSYEGPQGALVRIRILEIT